MFNVTAEQALYDMSYINVVMYSKAMPLPGDRNEDKPLFDDSKDACNPDNFTDFTDEEEVVRV